MSRDRESAPPPFIKPGDNPALDVAVARLRKHEASARAPAKAAGEASADAAKAQPSEVLAEATEQAKAVKAAEAATEQAKAVKAAEPAKPAKAAKAKRTAWWVMALAALSIAGAVVVMMLAVIGTKERGAEEAAASAEPRERPSAVRSALGARSAASMRNDVGDASGGAAGAAPPRTSATPPQRPSAAPGATAPRGETPKAPGTTPPTPGPKPAATVDPAADPALNE